MYLLRRIRVSCYRSYRLDVRPCLVRKLHQAPHQLTKGSVVLGIFRLKLLEIQTDWEWGSSTKTNTKFCPCVCSETCCEMVKCQHPNLSQTATSTLPELAKLLIGTIRFGLRRTYRTFCYSPPQDAIHMHHWYYGNRARPDQRYALARHCSNIRLFVWVIRWL